MIQPASANVRPIRLEQRSPFYCRVTFDVPPLNIFGPKNIPELNDIIAKLEADEQVKVVVFDSAVEGFFLTHYDFLAKPEDQPNIPPGPTGLQPLPDLLARLSRAPVVSIASIRGRLQVSGASSLSHAICVSRVGKKLSCPNGKSVLAWFQAAAQWRAYRD